MMNARVRSAPTRWRIIGHKILFLCAFVALLGARPAAGTESGDVRAAPTLQALLALGTRYRYGGHSPETGFDCSGLVAHAFEQAWGLILPRRAEEQRSVGRPVAKVALEPGDLVFYNTRNRAWSHVGIYVGEGKFVHAPRPGARVRVESLESPYWRTRFNGARRIEPPV